MKAKITRRDSLLGAGATIAFWQCGLRSALGNTAAPPHIATNTYPWRTFAKRAMKPYSRHTDELLADIARAGIDGYEPIIESPDEFKGLGDRLQKHHLQMRSIYVNSVLHEPSKADSSTDAVLRIGETARKLGVRIVVTNPSPIRWGGSENKTDSQLLGQAKALDRLGAKLRELDLVLAYHNHDAELRMGAREFHHMLTATDPSNVKFCLDSHWIYRGCGDSQVALFDVLNRYHDRIVELHLRQSSRGVWTEEFHVTGDIDYVRLFKFLTEKEIRPHLVLEQAVEKTSPNELTAFEAHRRGHDHLVEALQ